MKLFLFLGLITGINVNAQVKISGRCVDNKNHPLTGVSVSLKNSYDGGTSDSSGNFSFSTMETGTQDLQATFSGYSSYNKNIILGTTDIVANVSLRELITELKAVVITAGSFEAGDAKKTTVLTSIDIVTTASAEGDITGALKTLPGTQQVGETGGLFVRGGTATESKIFIDGNLVNNFFYSSMPGIASRGRFNPFLFKGTVFSSGGYSALYGQALSAALILESTDLPERTSADLSLSVIGGGGGIQKLSKNKKSSWGASYNYVNLWLAFNVIKQKQDYFRVPTDQQIDANFRVKTRDGMIKYYGYANWNKVGFRTQDIDSLNLKNAFTLNNINVYHNLSWKEKFGKSWRMNTGLSFSTNRDEISNELQDESNKKTMITNPLGYAFKNFSLISNAQYAQARVVLEKRLKGLNAIRFGADHFYSREKSTYTLYDGTGYDVLVKDNLSAAFAETDFYVTNNIAAKLGTRAEYSALMQKWNIAPRISLAYKFKNNSQASFAYGIFYQNPETRYLPSLNTSLGYAKASHYILQYQRITSKRTFRTEAFYKNYDKLFKTGFDGFGRDVAVNNNGYGYAKGIELFWRDKATVKNLDYWVSYSYLDTKRDFLSYPSSIRPSFAATHTASLVLKKFVMPWKTGFNASYTYASGRPYYQLKYDMVQSKYLINDQGNTKDYGSLGFSVNYLPNLGNAKSKAFAVWVLSVSNVLGQRNIFGYNYASMADRKVAIVPPSYRFVYVGAFFSFGIDRTQDAINNNL